VRISVGGTTDISDRAARDMGSAGIEDLGTTGDGLANVAAVLLRNQVGAARAPFSAPLWWNGTTWDHNRNLQAAGPKFALGVGTRVEQAVYGGFYRSGIDLLRAVAAINQFNVYRLRNPAASGKNVFVTYVGAEHSAARRFGITRPAAQAADRTTVITTRSRSSTVGANVAAFSNDNNVAANLAPIDLHGEVLQAGVMRDYAQPFMIGPGDAVEIQVGDITDAAGESSTLNVEWYEEA